MMMAKTRNKIAELNNILLVHRQNISNVDCDMQVYIHYTRFHRTILWTQNTGCHHKDVV